MKTATIEGRLEFIKQVILNWRTHVGYYKANPLFDLYPLTHGFISLLEYIRDGDPRLITDSYLRNVVQQQLRRGYKARVTS